MGNVLSEFTTDKKEAISDRTAYLMANLMQGVVNGGTGYALRGRFGFKGEIAGKTGTTNDNADGWFIGYTPKLTAGAWVGFEDVQIHFTRTGDGGGAAAALPIWGFFMDKVFKDPSLSKYVKETFDAPAGFELNLNCDGEVVPGEEVPGEGVAEEVVVEVDAFEEEKDIYGFE